MIQAQNLSSTAELAILEQGNPRRDVIYILFYVDEYQNHFPQTQNG